MPEDPAAPNLRASDEDREHVVEALTDHCAAGRLTLDELPKRVARAYAATTLNELAEVGPRADVLTEALRMIAPHLGAYGYELVGTAPDRLMFERCERPVWTIVVAIFLFPIGLIALTHTRTMRVQLDFEELGERRTRLTAYGTAPLAVRRAFAQLRA